MDILDLSFRIFNNQKDLQTTSEGKNLNYELKNEIKKLNNTTDFVTCFFLIVSSIKLTRYLRKLSTYIGVGLTDVVLQLLVGCAVR